LLAHLRRARQGRAHLRRRLRVPPWARGRRRGPQLPGIAAARPSRGTQQRPAGGAGDRALPRQPRRHHGPTGSRGAHHGRRDGGGCSGPPWDDYYYSLAHDAGGVLGSTSSGAVAEVVAPVRTTSVVQTCCYACLLLSSTTGGLTAGGRRLIYGRHGRGSGHRITARGQSFTRARLTYSSCYWAATGAAAQAAPVINTPQLYVVCVHLEWPANLGAPLETLLPDGVPLGRRDLGFYAVRNDSMPSRTVWTCT
jgi:hypothetical protein